MASSENVTDIAFSSWSTSGIFTTGVSESDFSIASSLSLSLTAASTSDEPPLTSVTWGSLSSTIIPTPSIDSATESASEDVNSLFSSEDAFTSDPFTTTTFDPTTSSWITTSDVPSTDVPSTDDTSTDDTSVFETSAYTPADTTSAAPVSAAPASTADTSSSSQQTTARSPAASRTTNAESATASKESATSTDTSGKTWSQFTTMGEITSDGRVITVELTSSVLVAITQATTVSPESSVSPTADAENESSEGGTKTSTKIAVGVVVPVGALSILALGFYFMRRHKHIALRNEKTPSESDYDETSAQHRRHSKHNSINAHHMF